MDEKISVLDLSYNLCILLLLSQEKINFIFVVEIKLWLVTS